MGAPGKGMPTPSKPLPRAFYDRDTVAVARELLGKHLVHVSRGVERIGRIVEVEAYLGTNDLASHSSRGMTGRTRVMFGPPGHAYVYLVYGMHCCMNVVTQREGHASAVLLRAVEPVKNVEGSTRGPGRLCKAMRIDRGLNGHDLTGGDFYIADPPVPETSLHRQESARRRRLRGALGEKASSVLHPGQPLRFEALEHITIPSVFDLPECTG